MLFYGQGEFVELHVFILIHPAQGCERINFHDSTSKRQVKLWSIWQGSTKMILSVKR